MSHDDISAQDALHVLWHTSGNGIRPGRFTEQLIDLALVADPQNLARLELGFPGLIGAVRLSKQPGGTDRLLDMVPDWKTTDR